MAEHEHKHEKMKPEPENIKELLGVVSSEVPLLIKNLLSSIFSEEAGRTMGKAAAAYYKELKEGGLPDQVAVKLTEEYMRTFTSLGDVLRHSGRSGHDLGEEIEREIHEKERRKRETEEDKGE
jgi:hypothetical protein